MAKVARSTYFVLAVCGVLLLAAAARADDVADARDRLYASYADQLKELATWCDEHQLTSQAELTRRWLPLRDPFKIYAFELPSSAVLPAELTNGREATEWSERFWKLRRKQADALFELANEAIRTHQPRVARELVVETVRENPDHERGRGILGYQKQGTTWQTAYVAAKLKSGQVWHDKFGWLPATYVERYENGQRYFNGRWIPAQEDARLHRDIRTPWQVETEHYSLATDSSLEEGVHLSRQLARLYDVWQQVFCNYAMSEVELAKLFQSPDTPHRSRKEHNVVYFRDEDEYIRSFEGTVPSVGNSLGIYRSDKRAVYFFAGDKQYAGTIDHEATHQLFWETRPVVPNVGAKNNFWAVEAVACFMESLVAHEGYYTLGGPDAGRVPAARERLLIDGFYVPLAELTAMGMNDIQRDSRLPKLYSQSSGLAWFFMSGQGGRYRDVMVNYLKAIYEGRADAGTLAKLTGKSYEALDLEYREFMKQVSVAKLKSE